MAPSEPGIKIFHRDVKFPRLEFRTGKLELILPLGSDPDAVLIKHRKWIDGKLEFINDCLKNTRRAKLADRSDEAFRLLVTACVEDAACQLGVTVNEIRFRRMKTKWASCSPRGNLTVNRLGRHLPSSLINYIVFHEVAHLVEKRHSDLFWRMVSRRFSNPWALEKQLFTHWLLIQLETGEPAGSGRPAGHCEAVAT